MALLHLIPPSHDAASVIVKLFSLSSFFTFSFFLSFLTQQQLEISKENNEVLHCLLSTPNSIIGWNDTEKDMTDPRENSRLRSNPFGND